MTSIIHEIVAEFLENILETLKPHEGMKWEEISAKLMKCCKEPTARFIRAATEGLDQELRSDKAGRKRTRPETGRGRRNSGTGTCKAE